MGDASAASARPGTPGLQEASKAVGLFSAAGSCFLLSISILFLQAGVVPCAMV